MIDRPKLIYTGVVTDANLCAPDISKMTQQRLQPTPCAGHILRLFFALIAYFHT